MKHADTLYSAEDYVFHQRPPKKRPGWWKWVPVLILGGLFVYRSTRPVMQLAPDPPPAFYDDSRNWDRQERQHQHHLARAYWSVAVRRIQTYYSPESPLPVDPPPQFRIAGTGSTVGTDATAGRVRYWHHLRRVWSLRDTWVVSYGWNTDWLERALNSFPRYVPKSVTGLFQRLVNFFNAIGQEISLH